MAMKMAISFRSEFPRLTLLCKWDCGWYESIARQGYRSPVPPLFQNSEESNVAFFPAYPTLGRWLGKLLDIPFGAALPLVSILSAFIFSWIFSRFLARETEGSQRIRFVLLLGYPATFYLLVSYSEALYLLGTFGVLYFALDAMASGAAGVGPKIGRIALLAAPFAFGVLLGGTRLTGFLMPGFLALGAIVYAWPQLRSGVRRYIDEARMKRTLPGAIGAVIGILGFFTYCAIRFGQWNMYFQQLRIGWYKEFSPAKALYIAFHPPQGFEPSFVSFLGNTRAMSWLIVNTMIILLTYASVRAVASAVRFYRLRSFGDFIRCVLVWGAAVHFFIVICGDVGPWDYWGNGMRYSMPSVYLLAALWRDEWTPAPIRERLLWRRVAIACVFAIAILGFAIEVEYIGRFIRNEWVS
jgi:hypothetical protein